MSNQTVAQENIGRILKIVGAEAVDLYGRNTRDAALVSISKALIESSDTSMQSVSVGEKDYPFSVRGVQSLRITNEHHSTCLDTEVASTVGLGFTDGTPKPAPTTDPATGASVASPDEPYYQRQIEPSKADDTLDPLCSESFAQVLWATSEDLWELGNGFMEIVRGGTSGQITGVHHIPASTVRVVVDKTNGEYHYVVRTLEGVEGDLHFARYGLKDQFLANRSIMTLTNTVDPKKVSEVVHFRRPTARSRWFGMPHWLSGAVAIELGQMLNQWRYDYFLNRGVPEFLLCFLGKKLPDDQWKQVEQTLQSNIGLGNTHKSLALNIDDPDMEVVLKQFAQTGQSEGQDYSSAAESLGLRVTSAHGVPPLLAGIVVPGKLGANNELPNALMSFQLLRVGPMQRLMYRQLVKVFCGPDSGLGLKPADFALRTIVDEMNLKMMDTVGRMRQSLPEAQAQGRDLTKGMKH